MDIQKYELEARQLENALSEAGGLVTWCVDVTNEKTGKLLAWSGHVKEAHISFRIEARLPLRGDWLKCYVDISRDMALDLTPEITGWIRTHIGDAIGRAIMAHDHDTAPIRTGQES